MANILIGSITNIPDYENLIIIKDYSPKFDYIVKGPKVYYSIKNKDHWVDISQNDNARYNLMNHIATRHGFDEYKDGESEIFNKIKNEGWAYEKYLKEQKEVKIKSNNPLPEVVKLPELPKHKTLSEYALERYSLNPNLVLELPAKQPLIKKKPTEQKSFFNKLGKLFTNATMSAAYADPTTAYVLTQPQLNTPSLKETIRVLNPGDAGIAFNLILDGKYKEAYDLVADGLSRKVSKNLYKKTDDPISTFPVDSLAFGPLSVTGDTIYDIESKFERPNTFYSMNKNRVYAIPENLNMQDFTFGIRNRGDYTPLNTEGAIIPSLYDFKSFGKQRNAENYMGIDPAGNFKVGDISNFEEGDILTNVIANDIMLFLKDDDGNFITSKSKHNPNQDQPAYIIWNNGNPEIKDKGQAINILIARGDNEGLRYGAIVGGKILVKVGNEIRLLSGSLSQIDQAFEEMKKRNHAEYGTFYTLDNGAYNRGARTSDQKLTTNDLLLYDKLNSSGGNFMYIVSRNNNQIERKKQWLQ